MERRRAREEQAAAVNKMFYQENSIVGDQQAVHYSVIAQVRKVCEVVDGFIYVANAEAHKSKGFLFIYSYFVNHWNVIKDCKEYSVHQILLSNTLKICSISTISSWLIQLKRSPILDTLAHLLVRGYGPFFCLWQMLIWLASELYVGNDLD